MSLLQDMKTLFKEYTELCYEEINTNYEKDNSKRKNEIQYEMFMMQTKQEQEVYALTERLNYYKTQYNQGHPVINDENYDKLYFELAELEKYSGIVAPDSPTKIYNLDVNRAKESFDYTIFDKYLTREIKTPDEFQNADIPNLMMLIEPNGVFCTIRYINGYLNCAIAYEKDVINQDITDNLLIMAPNIPRRIDYKKEIILQGKLTFLLSSFNNNYFIKQHTIHDIVLDKIKNLSTNNNSVLTDLTFAVTNIEVGFEEKTSNKFNKMCYLSGLGLLVPFMINLKYLDFKFLNDYFKTKGYESKLIFSNALLYYMNQPDNGQKERFVYKYFQNSYQAKIIDIVWDFIKQEDANSLFPVIVHTPIQTGDELLRQTPLQISNILDFEFIRNKYCFQKDQIIDISYESRFLCQQIKTIYPNAQEYDEEKTLHLPILTHCPYCQQQLRYTHCMTKDSHDNEIDTIKNIICDNPTCPGKQINKIKYFLGENGFNIAIFSDEIVDYLYAKGWIHSIIDLYALKKYEKEWCLEPGFNKENVTELLNAIENTKNSSFSTFLNALHIPSITKQDSVRLARTFTTFEKFFYAIYSQSYNFSQLGFSQEQIKNLIDFDYTQANAIWRVLLYNENIGYDKNYFYMPLRKKTYVVIGPVKYFDSVEWLCGYIHGEGGAVVTEVTENVDYVINNDPDSDCPENVAARELDIPIITEEEFLGNIY